MRIMTWNIAEGRELNGEQPFNSQLPLIAQRIEEQAVDLVLLNELRIDNRWPFGSGVHQPRVLMEMTGFPHGQWGFTARLGWAGHKAVAVFSRWPLGDVTMHPLPNGYALLKTSAIIDGLTHHLVSLRLNAYDPVDKAIGIAVLTELLQSVPPGEAFVAAGDFNSKLTEAALAGFTQNSGLRHAGTEQPDAQSCDPENVIDHIFFRGPYQLSGTERRCPAPHPSDHPWEVADVTPNEVARTSPHPLFFALTTVEEGLWQVSSENDGSWGNGTSYPLPANPVNHRVKAVALDDGVHVCIITGGRLRHGIRRPDGTWTGFSDVPLPCYALGFDIAGGGVLTLVLYGALGPNYKSTALFSGSWHWDGTWSQFVNVSDRLGLGDLGFGALVACARTSAWGAARFHICASYHDPKNAWQPRLVHIEGGSATHLTSYPEPQALACAGIGNELHILAIDLGRNLWYATQRSDGSWTPEIKVPGLRFSGGFPESLSACTADRRIVVCGCSQIAMTPGTLIRDEEFRVYESDGDVDTGIDVEPGDELRFDAAGKIWAGVTLTFGTNGPSGWANVDHDPKFPLHVGPDAHPFSLLGKLGAGGNYFFIGDSRPRAQFAVDSRTPLFLRINDDLPGNGSGSFTCRIRQWRSKPDPESDVVYTAKYASMGPDGTWSEPRAVLPPEPVGLTVDAAVAAILPRANQPLLIAVANAHSTEPIATVKLRQIAGTTGAFELFLRNRGPEHVTVTSAYAFDFYSSVVLDPIAGTEIPPDTTITVGGVVSPPRWLGTSFGSSPPPFTITLDIYITTDDPLFPRSTLDVEVEALEPPLAMLVNAEPEEADFPVLGIGQTYTLYARIHNRSSRRIDITAATLNAESPAGEFNLTVPADASIEPSAERAVSMIYAPTQRGPATAEASIRVDSLEGAPESVTFQIPLEGWASDVWIDPLGFDFGDVPTEQVVFRFLAPSEPPIAHFEIRNGGAQDVRVVDTVVADGSAPFSVTPPQGDILAGLSATLTVALPLGELVPGRFDTSALITLAGDSGDPLPLTIRLRARVFKPLTVDRAGLRHALSRAIAVLPRPPRPRSGGGPPG